MNELNEKLEKKPAPKRTRAVWTGLAAAVLAMVLVVSAGAAVSSLGGFDSVTQFGGGDYANGYHLAGGAQQRLPVAELTEDALALEESAVRVFDGQSWNAAAEFCGVVLPENAALNGLSIGGSSVTVSKGATGITRLRFDEWTDSMTVEYVGGKYNTVNKTGNGIHLGVSVYTDLAETIPSQDYAYAFYDVSTEEYVAANGLSAVITHLTPTAGLEGADERPERYVADFLLGCCQYHIEADVTGSADDTLELMHSIVGGFAPDVVAPTEAPANVTEAPIDTTDAPAE